MRKILAVLTLGATMAISTGAAFAESAGGGASHDPVSATENATVIEVSGTTWQWRPAQSSLLLRSFHLP